MSISLMSSVWSHSKHSGSELLVLLALADMANDEGVCWPGKARLAAKCRLSTSRLKRVLAALEASGELVVTRRPQAAALWNTNVYKIILPGGVHAPTLGAYTPLPGGVHAPTLGAYTPLPGGVHAPTPGGVHAPTLGASAHPESSYKHHDNRQVIGAAGAAENPPTPLDDDELLMAEIMAARRTS